MDTKNSVFKAEHLDVDQFGYTSVHMVVCISKDRSRLSEWQAFKDLKAEIQLRTFLQHAWSNISHHFDYKLQEDIPKELRRKLFRLAALVELADEELDNIVNDISHLTNQYRVALDKGDAALEINVDSLRTYVESSQEVEYWNNFLRETTKQKVESWGDLSRDVRIAHYCGLHFISEIDDVLKSAHGWGKKFFLDYYHKFFEKHNVIPGKVITVVNGTLTQL